MRAVVRLVCALVLALVLAMIFFEDGSGRHATAAATAAQQRRPPRVHKRTPDRVGRFAAFSCFAIHANDAAARLEAFSAFRTLRDFLHRAWFSTAVRATRKIFLLVTVKDADADAALTRRPARGS